MSRLVLEADFYSRIYDRQTFLLKYVDKGSIFQEDEAANKRADMTLTTLVLTAKDQSFPMRVHPFIMILAFISDPPRRQFFLCSLWGHNLVSTYLLTDVFRM